MAASKTAVQPGEVGGAEAKLRLCANSPWFLCVDCSRPECIKFCLDRGEVRVLQEESPSRASAGTHGNCESPPSLLLRECIARETVFSLRSLCGFDRFSPAFVKSLRRATMLGDSS